MTTKRGRGRPRLVEGVETMELGLTITEPDYKRVEAIATAERISVQAVIRRALARYLKPARRPRTSRSVVIPQPRIGL